ncbi:MAG: hypothetical protein OIN85_09305 [Candidatus Methanoperedens sp.]|nr:hypothetical protein [Candidatus Methanoperedens sp.]
MNKIHMRNFGLLSGIILFTVLITTPALADPGLFTGCVGAKQGTISNIQAGTLSKELRIFWSTSKMI